LVLKKATFAKAKAKAPSFGFAAQGQGLDLAKKISSPKPILAPLARPKTIKKLNRPRKKP
jgi:hypothetical protein